MWSMFLMSEFYFWVGVCEFSLNIGVKFIGLKRLNNCPLVLEQSYQKSLTSKRHIIIQSLYSNIICAASQTGFKGQKRSNDICP